MLFVASFLWFHFWLRSLVIQEESGEMICNAGGPFGTPLPNVFLLVIGIGVGIFLIREWRREKTSWGEWPWLLLLAAGAGNLLERARFGCIMDYIGSPSSPLFNVADILLTIGALGIVFRVFSIISRKSKESIKEGYDF